MLPWRARHGRCPTVLQMEGVECGAACLAMILAYHGRWVPLIDLRVQCGVSRDGTTAADIASAAAHHGLRARGLQVDVRGLDQLRLPAIVFWEHDHFVVLERLTARSAWVNNPDEGRYRLTRAEFEAVFANIALEFEPGPAFCRGGRRSQAFARMAKRLTRSTATIGFVVATALTLGVLGFAMLAFTQLIIDRVLVQEMRGWLAPLLLAMTATVLLRSILSWLGKFYLVRLKSRLMAILAVDVADRLLRLPMRFFAQRQPGDIGQRLGALDRLGTALSVQVAALLIGVLTALVYGAALLIYDRILVCTALGFLVATLVLTVFGLRWKGGPATAARMRLGRLSGAGVNALQLIETAKSMGLERGLLQRMGGLHAEWASIMHRVQVSQAFASAAPRLVSELGGVVVLGLGIARVMGGAISVGELVVFQALLGSVQSSLASLVLEVSNLQTVQGEVLRLDDILEHPLDPRSPPLAAMPERLRGHVEFRDVTFGYSAPAPLIDKLSFTVQPGEQLALVGSTGSGKSTIAKLLCGLYQPWSGQILIDGVPLNTIPQAVLSRSLASVDQQIFHFQGSIRDNLTLWDASIDQAEIERAAMDAAIHDTICRRRGRYQAVVAEGGSNFSGGEAQRLDIARALVNNPAILVLDEATAALDTITEAAILASLRRRRMTRIIVAHRLSAVRDSDRILLIEAGRVVEDGTHDQLVRNRGRYASLVRVD